MTVAPPAGPAPGGFFAYEDGEVIAFAAGAALPPVCFKCGRQRAIRFRAMRFTLQRTFGADVARQVLSGTRTYVTQRGRIPICRRCEARRWIGPAVAALGGLLLVPYFHNLLGGSGETDHPAWPRDLAESALWLGVVVAPLGAYLTWAAGLRARRVDEDGVLALFGVHRLARADVLAASEGRFVPDEEPHPHD